MTRYFVEGDSLTAIADAIRAHTGGTDLLTLDGMAEAIASIEAGGGGSNFFITEVVPSENIQGYAYVEITHTLGAIPDFALVAWRAYDVSTIQTNAVYGGFAARTADSAAKFVSGCMSVDVDGAVWSATARLGRGNTETWDGVRTFTTLPAPILRATSTTAHVAGCANNSVPFLQAGAAYLVILGVLE